mgnify:CR=1 FL=1
MSGRSPFKLFATSAALAGLAAASIPATAGGLFGYELGTADLGLASRRPVLAIALGPLAAHALVTATWWGLFRWVVRGDLGVLQPELPDVGVGERHVGARANLPDLVDQLGRRHLAAQQRLVADDDGADALGVGLGGAQSGLDLLGVVLRLARDPDAEQHVEIVLGGEVGDGVEALRRAVGADAVRRRRELAQVLVDQQRQLFSRHAAERCQQLVRPLVRLQVTERDEDEAAWEDPLVFDVVMDEVSEASVGISKAPRPATHLDDYLVAFSHNICGPFDPF